MRPELSFVLLASLSACVSAHPVKHNEMLTLPLRRYPMTDAIHPELRHQQQVNRAERLLARSNGETGPSDAQLRRNLERTLSSLQERGEISSSDMQDMSRRESDIFERDENNHPVANHSMVLNIDGADVQYLATIPIGTPTRNFSVIIDSGSAVFWVGSNDCEFDQGGSCGNHTFLSEKESSSFVNTGQSWHAAYGSGNATGDVVTDTVVIAGMTLSNLTFGVAHVLSSEFTKDPAVDGLMGLARSEITALKIPTPVEALKKRGLISAAITSYRIPRRADGDSDVGEITFGGLDESKFNTSTLVIMTSTDNGFWIAEMGPVTINGQDLGFVNKTALLDTGTTLMAVSSEDAKTIHDKIPGARQGPQGYTVPCDTSAAVVLTFGGKTFPIDVKELARGSASQKTGDCGSGISVSANAGNRWLVGDTFLKSVYFSTNGDTNEISLAKLL
ncbi:aspartic peptidase domain-containing protein [Mycena sp. CBHHK59/15]|nr:aspartic peptidase domain-containing protein [Mycena sp. CBHHK59/15]